MKPTYLLELWTMEGGEVTFSPITDRTFQECKRWYEYHEMLSGTIATVFCFFSDDDINKSEALEMATRFMHGKYKLVNVDLYWGKRTILDGIDLTHPRQ